MGFVHLHCHSNYSLLSGASSVVDLLARAKELGMSHLALTDTNNLYGAYAFCKAAEEMGIEPIVGAQVDFSDGDVVLLVADDEGYGNLCEILTQHNVDGPQKSGEQLAKYHRGLIALVRDIEQAERLREIVPDGDLYLEVRHVSCRGGSRTALRTLGTSEKGEDASMAQPLAARRGNASHFLGAGRESGGGVRGHAAAVLSYHQSREASQTITSSATNTPSSVSRSQLSSISMRRESESLCT